MGTLLQQLHQGTAQENAIYCKRYIAGPQNVFRIQKVMKPYKWNQDSITFLNFNHHVFITTIKRPISQNPNEAVINHSCFCMLNVSDYSCLTDSLDFNHSIVVLHVIHHTFHVPNK